MPPLVSRVDSEALSEAEAKNGSDRRTDLHCRQVQAIRPSRQLDPPILQLEVAVHRSLGDQVSRRLEGPGGLDAESWRGLHGSGEPIADPAVPKRPPALHASSPSPLDRLLHPRQIQLGSGRAQVLHAFEDRPAAFAGPPLQLSFRKSVEQVVRILDAATEPLLNLPKLPLGCRKHKLRNYMRDCAGNTRMGLMGLVALAAAALLGSPATLGSWDPVGRSPRGRPSDVPVRARVDSAGFQQGVHYRIEAVLDEEGERLRAAAVLTYTNRSPDTLGVLFLHLHLNAFRPNSLWARTEKRSEFDFQALEEPDYAFERLLAASSDDRPLSARYPEAPDSTVVELTLPSPLGPGGEVSIDLRWEARPSTLCRRQCRSGRHYDFAHWYPRIAVYDEGGWQQHPLYPQGEFFGEFSTFDVILDLAEDQVIGATGVPIAGDPGWRSTSPRATEPSLQEDFYGRVGPRSSPGWLPSEVAAGRKRVRFYAEDVHHFAWSVDPSFRYEGGAVRRGAAPSDAGPSVHVLYRAGNEESWGGGQALQRTIAALRWLEDLFGPYPYPQLTNLHRLEGGGTEFPMVVMNGSAGEGLIRHEVAHQYVHAIMANNEWREAWLDEGFASFLSAWFREGESGPDVWRNTMSGLARLERLGLAEPVSTPAEDFSSFQMYGAMSYGKASVIFRMLREVLGEENFRLLLREYYDRYRFRHVSESDLRHTAETVSGRPLGWFFEAWLHGTGTLDYGVGEVRRERLADGRWRTTVAIERLGDIWMPVTVRVDDALAVVETGDRLELVELTTSERPRVVELDPDHVLLDKDRSNNRVVLD